MQLEPRLLASYRDFAESLIAEGILSDPWTGGVPRFRMTPIVLDPRTKRELDDAAEAMVSVYTEAVRLCASDPALVGRFFDLPPGFRQMWRMSFPAWHGVARADVFLTPDGPQVCELNSDTPSGEPEAVALNHAVDGTGAAFLHDPNRALAGRIAAMVATLAHNVGAHSLRAALGGERASERTPAVGIVYPTEMTEDLPMIELYVRWFQRQGVRVVLGSPFNLHADGFGGVALFGTTCAVIWRHYKTDWWGERRPVWRSEPCYADAAPLSAALDLLAAATARRRCAVINPFGSVLTQNKRMMALMWEEIGRFPSWAQASIRRHLPYTVRLEQVPLARLRAERELWVLKSDYGCEGDEVVIGSDTSPADWARTLDDAIPNRWIVQRRFRARETWRGRVPNYGVYVVRGRACGLFTRLQAGGDDRSAVSAATMLRLS